jgi:hypothetical protein
VIGGATSSRGAFLFSLPLSIPPQEPEEEATESVGQPQGVGGYRQSQMGHQQQHPLGLTRPGVCKTRPGYRKRRLDLRLRGGDKNSAVLVTSTDITGNPLPAAAGEEARDPFPAAAEGNGFNHMAPPLARPITLSPRLARGDVDAPRRGAAAPPLAQLSLAPCPGEGL